MLRFYDGICHWEEDANTPVLHIGWARPLVNTISKFDASIRAQVQITCYVEDSKFSEGSSDESVNHNNNNYYKTKVFMQLHMKSSFLLSWNILLNFFTQ